MKKLIAILVCILSTACFALDYSSKAGYICNSDGTVNMSDPENINVFLRSVTSEAVPNKWSDNWKGLKEIADNTHVPMFVFGGNKYCTRVRDFIMHQILTKEFLEVANEHNDMLLCFLGSRGNAAWNTFVKPVNTQSYSETVKKPDGSYQYSEGKSFGCPKVFLYQNSNLPQKIRFCIESDISKGFGESVTETTGSFGILGGSVGFVWSANEYMSVFAVQLQNFFSSDKFGKFPEFLHAHLDHESKAITAGFAVWEDNTIAQITIKKRDQEKFQTIEEYNNSSDKRNANNSLSRLQFKEVTPSWFMSFDHVLTSATVAESGGLRPTLDISSDTNGVLTLRGLPFNGNPIDVVSYTNVDKEVAIVTNILDEAETSQGLETNLVFVTSNNVYVIRDTGAWTGIVTTNELKVPVMPGCIVRLISDGASIDMMEFESTNLTSSTSAPADETILGRIREWVRAALPRDK